MKAPWKTGKWVTSRGEAEWKVRRESRLTVAVNDALYRDVIPAINEMITACKRWILSAHVHF